MFRLWPSPASTEAAASAARSADASARRAVALGAQIGRPFRYLAVATLAVVVVGGWLYLYFQARSVDLGAANEVLGALRELKEIDQRWNDRLIGARLAPQAMSDAELAATRAAANLPAVGRLQAQLAQRSFDMGGLLGAPGLAALRAAFDAKAGAVDAFLDANRAYRASLARFVRTGDALAAEASERAATRTPLPAALERALERATAATLAYAAQPGAAVAAAAERAIAQLALPEAGDPLRESVAEFADAARRTFADRRTESMLFGDALLASTGPRLESLTKAFETEFGNAIVEAERYRLYLLVYSGLLLVLAAYLGWRLARSYAVINRINQLLREANEGLERRVAERTRELSDALAQLKEQEVLLIQSEKMSSLGQMVAGVAHEVNTPLAYVKASLDTVSGRMPLLAELAAGAERLLELLRSDASSEADLSAQFARVSALVEQANRHGRLEELRTLVTDGLHGIGQIAELVTNLRNFARLDRSKVAEFDLNEGVQSALNIARNQLKQKTVRTMFGALPKVSCSPSQINQVFLNLITNAAQATPAEGGVITLRTALHGDRQVMVEVSDNGHGIPQDVLPRIFDPFFTTKEVGKGTGLGLSISYKIIEDHGGRIEVDSKPGVGTRFRVILPKVPAAGDAAASVPDRLPATAAR
ncbi:MAG: ATP-binding protein [Burkholderiales bacterium]|nr:ATP-binding protein [Burkholderiales bacterium]